jgi:hypothetical protein
MTQEDWKDSLIRRLEILEQDVRDIKLRMSLEEVQSAVHEVHRTNSDKRLSSVEGGQVWLVRVVLGAIVIALISFVISGGIYVP